MKKILFLFVALCFPFLMFAQLMDTVNVLLENFDGSTINVTTTTTSTMGGMSGDWKLDNTLHVSSPNSFHSPVYPVQNGNSDMRTMAVSIPGTSLGQPNRVYLEFDHICKVSQMDRAAIFIQLGYVDANGQTQWGVATQMPCTKDSSFYYGEAESLDENKFGDYCYNVWQKNSMGATPTNAWWKTELFDISRFVLNKTISMGGTNHDVTHFRLIFRVTKITPASIASNNCAGWYVDNLKCFFSNCEMIRPKIELQNPIYVNQNNNLKNNIGPYTIKTKITDNDTLNLNTLQFTYQLNNETPIVVPNDITSNTRTAKGHQILAQWDLPNICYGETIRYNISVSDVHGSVALPIDTPMTAWHDQTNIHQNDCHIDSLNTFPHCFITGVAEPVTLYFKNKSDAAHSPGSIYQTSLNVTLKVENANHVVTHNSNHDWTGSLCFDEPSSLSLGTFVPTHGLNYITVYINTRNGQADGFHGTPTNISDTIRFVGYSCDSLLHGDYTVGGPNADFATMLDVKDALTYCGVNGPTIFHFRPGTYQDFDFRSNYIGQSEVNTITFQGDDVNTVIVTNNHPDTNANIYGAVTLIHVENFIFKNLTIQGKSTAVSRGVVLRGNGSVNIVFDGCKITANATNTTDNTSFVLGRSVATAASAGQTAVSDDVVIRNCVLSGGNFGIYYIGSTQRRNTLLIANNRFINCYKGIYLSCANPVIENNHLSQAYSSNPKNFIGIHTEQTIGADINNNTIDSTYDVEYGILFKTATVEDFYIRNNHVLVGNSNYGIDIESSSATATDTGFIYNNEVILYPVVAANSYAVQIKSSNNLKVINNSFYVKSDAPYSNTAALRIENNNNTYIYNNLLLNYCNCADNTNYPLYLNGTSTITGDHNDFVSASGVIAYKSVARNSISELESAITTTQNNISLNPTIANPLNSLMPSDYMGLECGREMHVAADIRGVQRTPLTYMGAYAEQIAATDAAIVAMVSPVSGSCPQSAYNITVSVANKGSENLNFSNHHATVTLHSDTLNLTQTLNVSSGTVPVLGAVSKIVAQNVTIPVNQNIDFTFVISTTGDSNHANDTLRTMFVLEAATPDYEEDFSNGTKQTWTIEQLPGGAGNWTFQEGTGTYPAISPVYGTGRLFFNSKVFANNTASRAVMPVVNLTNAINPILEVWFAHDNTSNKAAEGVTVKISTDGGSTYTDLIPEDETTSLLKRFQSTATTPQWKLYTYDLSSYVSVGCVHIAFDAKSQAGNNINIDRIRLRNLLNNDIAVTNIYSQGETPSQYAVEDVVKALVKNEGRMDQSNVKVYLDVLGATEQTHDSITISSLASGAQTIVSFPNHTYNVNEEKTVRVRSRNDENNANNLCEWSMVTTENIVNYADTSAVAMKIGDYTNVIRPCVHYKASSQLVVNAVKYFYDQSYIADPEEGFRAFVANADGEIVATSELMHFSDLQQSAWNIIPIKNFALTNMRDIYVGIEMLAHGDYLCAQIETPLRDSVFYYLQNGAYVPQTSGRFMIGAVVDNPHIHDFAILSMLNPTTRCDLGHEHLSIEITNNGDQDILPGSVLNYTVNNLPVVSETVTDTLYRHQTTVFTFSSDFDFTNNLVNIDSNYQIKVWITKDAQDRLQFNDTLQLTISSLGKAALPILAADTIDVHYYRTGTLSATMPSSIAQGEFGWFTKSGYEQWNLLGYGDTYTTPVTFFDTVYYVNANPGSIYETTIGNGTTSGSQPFVFTSGYSRGKILFTENEVGSHGTITKIGFEVATAANGADGIPIRIYMKETNETSLPTASSAVDWDSELESATLVVDRRVFFDHTGWFYINLDVPFNYNSNNLVLYTETNCADYCTGTGSQCNNCGLAVSGGATTPNFKQNQIAGFVQYKNANAITGLSGNYTAYNKRLNTYFEIADLECGSEKVPVYVHVPDIPTYDVKTLSWDYPQTDCHLYDEHIKVSVKNMLNIPVPANKVLVHVLVNGTHLSQMIDRELAPEEEYQLVFDSTYDFSARITNATPNATNIDFDYTVYTTMPDEEFVYTGNDTISGSITSNRTAWMEPSYTYEGEYLHTLDILQPEDRLQIGGSGAVITKYFLYDANQHQINLSPATASFYTTPVLYDTAVYYIEAVTKLTPSCTTRRVPIYVNVRTPQYDLSTDNVVVPRDYQCGVGLSPTARVHLTFTDTAENAVLPAGTFKLTTKFSGPQTITDEASVGSTITHDYPELICGGRPLTNLISTTENRIYHYEFYTDPFDSSMYVYRNNDTIRGIIHLPAEPVAPAPINVSANYGETKTITPSASPLNYFYFYENAEDGEAIAQGLNFTTEPLYESQTYYYSGRIMSPGFDTVLQVGTATNAQTPFTFSSPHSYAKILYTAEEMGGADGTIDSISIYVANANSSGVGIPIKIWMKNGPDTNGLRDTPNLDWVNETATAQKVFDGELSFSSVGWLTIPIQGGFDYTSGGLYMYLEHDCGDVSCITSLGIADPKFQSTQYTTTNQKRVLTKYANTPLNAPIKFGLMNYRWNTRFSINHTCRSPRSEINVTINVPQHDVGVVAITAPETSSRLYSANESVTVTVKNYGAQSASNFPVSYLFDNQTPVTQNYTGTIAPGATGNMTFNTTVNLSDIYYETPLIAYTALSSDTYHNNDTCKMTVSIKDSCESKPAYNYATGAEISKVTFASMSNGSGTPYLNYTRPAGCDGRYTDYTHTVEPVEVVLGQTYPLSVTHSFESATGKPVYKWVYIDYNRDGDFYDAGELVAMSGAIAYNVTGANATYSIDVRIPDTAEVGPTRMRVICAVSNLTASYRPCGIFSSEGETEEYAVTIKSMFQHDLGVASFTQLNNDEGTLCPDQNAKIRVNVANYGLLTQTLGEDNPIDLTLNVTGPIPGTYTTSLSSGSMLSHDTVMLIFDNVNISSPGNYTFNVVLSYNGDMYAYNNERTASVTINSAQVSTLPYSQDFDLNNSDTDPNWLPASWTREQSQSYQWKVYKAADNSSSTTYGTVSPKYDHTHNSGNGHYLSILSSGGSATSPSKWNAMVTSGCIDLHYQDGYPAEVEVYDFFRKTNAAADFDLLVEAGTGDYFVTFDTLKKSDGNQLQADEDWKKHVSTLNLYDEVGQLRFRSINHYGKLNVAIDDINIQPSMPDLKIVKLVYPKSMNDTTDGDDACLSVGDTIYPKVRIQNNGNSAITNFDVMGIMKTGRWSDTIVSHFSDVLQPGESVDYVFDNWFILYDMGRVEFWAIGILDLDKDLDNNTKRVVSCTNSGVEDYETASGLLLYQNVPNPANSITRINYLVQQPGKAVLNIYSAMGQLLYTQTQEAMDGSNFFDVDVQNFADGVYYYTLYFNNESLTKKMVIQK